MSLIDKWYKETFRTKRQVESPAWGADPMVDNIEFRGFVQPLSGAMNTVSGAVSPDSTHRIYCPHGLDIIIGDQIIGVYGRVFVAVYVPESGVSGRGDHLEIEVRQN
jgi:hypothetical protein